jgi:NAD-dependent dihydropyrimidine dehydrogenase PreA subunit
MNNFIIPYINITPKNVMGTPQKYDIIQGKIKDSINCEQLIECGSVYKNEDFVKFVSESNNAIIPLVNYYDSNVKDFFDLYGCMYTENHMSVDFVIKLYFYKIKNIELLTWSEVEEVSGFVGNFKVKVRKKARYVDEKKCTGCGICQE